MGIQHDRRGMAQALDAEIALHDTAEERFGLMLAGAMIGADELAQLLLDYGGSQSSMD